MLSLKAEGEIQVEVSGQTTEAYDSFPNFSPRGEGGELERISIPIEPTGERGMGRPERKSTNGRKALLFEQSLVRRQGVEVRLAIIHGLGKAMALPEGGWDDLAQRSS